MTTAAIDLTTIIEKSSNVGASKIALSLTPNFMWHTLSAFGFGHCSGSDFPGEVPVTCPIYRGWNPTRQATISYGYGVAITALQLADAYDILADDGVRMPPSFLRLDASPAAQQVICRSGGRDPARACWRRWCPRKAPASSRM